jgi:hypothetical protein
MASAGHHQKCQWLFGPVSSCRATEQLCRKFPNRGGQVCVLQIWCLEIAIKTQKIGLIIFSQYSVSNLFARKDWIGNHQGIIYENDHISWGSWMLANIQVNIVKMDYL